MSRISSSVPSPAEATFDTTVRGLRHHPVNFVAALIDEYGDIVRLPFGERNLYLLNHPDFIREILTGTSETFAKRKDAEAEHGYLSQISGFVPLLEVSRIPAYAPGMVGAAERAHQRWQARYSEAGPFEVDIYREMGRITLEVVIQTVFEINAQAEAKELFDAILTMNLGYGFNPIEATLGVFMPPDGQTPPTESIEARAFIQRYVEGLVAAMESRPAANSCLAMLVKYLGAEKAVAAAMTIMLAMHEVTATTLPWCWRLLSRFPEAEARVHNELATILAGRLPTLADLSVLPYTNMMFEEVRRLYPSVWIVGRFLRRDHFFGDYLVPSHSVVLASQRIMHRDARYFPNPEQFDPLRWTPEARSERPHFSYFPFSAGPRACAGEAFAKAQDVLVFGTLAQRWRALPIPGQNLESVPQKSMAPRSGIRMILDVRNN